MENLEIEFKVIINKEDFHKLEKIMEEYEYELFEQVNTYYDSKEETLEKNKVSLRIRSIINKNIYITTLKETKKVGKLEHEFEVKGNDVKYLPDEIIQILDSNNVSINDLCVVGELKTIRKEYKYNNCVLCLDHNFYYGKEDYEIECEAKSMQEAVNTITCLLLLNKIPFVKSKYSKQARARKQYKIENI